MPDVILFFFFLYSVIPGPTLTFPNYQPLLHRQILAYHNFITDYFLLLLFLYSEL